MIAPLSNSDLKFFFSPAHSRLADRLAELAPQIIRGSEQGAPAAVAMLGESGLLDELLPRGGAVPDVRSLCLIREMLGFLSPLCDALFAVQGLGSYPLLIENQRGRDSLVDDFRAARAVAGFALTEPEAGSDVAGLRTVARPHGDGFVLEGKKTLISNVGLATHYVIFANADPGLDRRGISAFLVPANARGLTAEPFALNIDHPIGALHLRDCVVARDSLIGQIGDGFRLAMQTLDTFRVTVGAAAVGMARRALHEAIAHVRGRTQFGKPLAEQPVVQSMLADMATELDAARLLTLRAAHGKDTATGDSRSGCDAAMGKLYATEAAFRIIDQAVQLFGGLGVKRGQVVENLYRAIRPLRIYEGTSEIQRLIIGRALTKEEAAS